MPTLARRLLVSAGAGAVALGAGLVWLESRRVEPPPIELSRIVEDPEWVQRVRLLEERQPAEWIRALPDSTLARERIAPGDPKARFFPPLARLSEPYVYDERSVYRLPGGMRVEREWPEHPGGRYVAATNSDGLRMDGEVSAARPDVRVLLSGDSHMEGVCNNRETTAAELERRLASARPGAAVEVLNAAVGGYSSYNHLGVLERWLPAGIDALALVFYGGNDFAEALVYRHYYERTPRAVAPERYQALLDRASRDRAAAVGQFFNQAAYLARCPAEVPIAAATARDVLDEIARVAVHHGVRLLFVYLPSPTDVEWEHHREVFESVRDALELGAADLALADRLADELLAHLRSAGVEVLDARPLLQEGGPHYWQQDLHLNLAGHAVLAEAIAARLGDGG